MTDEMFILCLLRFEEEKIRKAPCAVMIFLLNWDGKVYIVLQFLAKPSKDALFKQFRKYLNSKSAFFLSNATVQMYLKSQQNMICGLKKPFTEVFICS